MQKAEKINIYKIEAGKNKNPDNLDVSKVKSGIENSGIVIISGFDFDLQNYEKLTRYFCSDFHMVAARHDYKSKEGDNYSTEVVPYNFTLLSHTEGTFQPLAKGVPDLCFFYCKVAPVEKGGETTILDGKLFLEKLPQQIKEKFLKHGITYEMLWNKSRWQNEFGIDTVAELENYLSNTKNVRYKIEDEFLNLFYTTEAITKSKDGSQVFATGMLAHLPKINHLRYKDIYVYTNPTNKVYFGNGEEISDEIINQLVDIQDELQFKHRWQNNDIVVIDNTRFLHGRTITEKDCERKLVSRFGRF